MKYISHVRLQNFASFGPEHPGVKLQPLSCLIGPNGSGKTNLLRGIWLASVGMAKIVRDYHLHDTISRFIYGDLQHTSTFWGNADKSERLDMAVEYDGAVVQRRYKHPLIVSKIEDEPSFNVEYIDSSDLTSIRVDHLSRLASLLLKQGHFQRAKEIYEACNRQPFPFAFEDGVTPDNEIDSFKRCQRLSYGQRNFLEVMMSLLNTINDGIAPILLDLPETSLHLEQQRIIGQLIVETSQRRQVIVATHSPEIAAEIEDRHFISCVLKDGESQFTSSEQPDE